VIETGEVGAADAIVAKPDTGGSWFGSIGDTARYYFNYAVNTAKTDAAAAAGAASAVAEGVADGAQSLPGAFVDKLKGLAGGAGDAASSFFKPLLLPIGLLLATTILLLVLVNWAERKAAGG